MCRQLGYPSGLAVENVNKSELTDPNQPIWLSEVSIRTSKIYALK